MKRVIRCLSCSNVVGIYKSYWVELEETPIVQGIRMPTQKVRGKICPECADLAGYKVRRKDVSTRDDISGIHPAVLGKRKIK